jgi:3-hydroxyisobutyrate dehydrogenase
MLGVMRPADPSRTRLGWIGTGVMGTSMCRRLLEAGFAATITTRTKAKAEPLLELGAVWVDTPEAVAERSDVVFSMLGYPSDVRSVLLGEGGAVGVVEAAAPGTVVVDMTTSEPALAQEIGARAASRGVHALDAPVTGGDVGARNGTLSIMVGGDEAAFDAVMPCLQVMGATMERQGGHGAGQHTKLVNQTMIAGTMVGMCEALLYAHRAGLDPERVLASVSGGAAGSWALANLAPRILAGDHAPGFYVEHFVKDMSIALAEAQRMQLALPGLALVHQLYLALEAQGHGRDGTQALIHALAAISGEPAGPF